MKSPVSDTPMECLLDDVPFYFDQDASSGALWVMLEPRPDVRSIYLSMLGCSGVIPADGKWHRLDPPVELMQPLHRQFLSIDMVTAPDLLRTLGLSCGDLTCPVHGDPDYDVTGPLDRIDDHIAYEQRVAGDYRAIRQTEQWKNRKAKPDPAAILDVCACGHDEATHFRGIGECMHSTPRETWACGCHEYRP